MQTTNTTQPQTDAWGNSNEKIKYLDKTQIRTFLNHCKKTNNRDYIMFLFCYKLGLRREEIRKIDISSINLLDRTIFIKAVKNGNSRNYDLTDEEYKLLRKYISTRKEIKADSENKDALFLSKRNKRISPAQLDKLFNIYRRKSRIKKGFSIHSFRHSIAMHSLNSNNPNSTLDYVQKHLRHKDIRSTQMYAHMFDSHAENIRKQLQDSGDTL